jgi:hypothetical protein
MREMMALTLALLLAIPAASGTGPLVVTRLADEGARGNFLINMSDEAARFLESLPEAERNWAGPPEGEQSETEISQEAARLRLRILQLSSGADVVLMLRDGQRVKGELAQAGKEEFSVRVPVGTGGSKDRPRIPKSYRYEDVQAADLPAPQGWKEPEKAREFKSGTGVELLLLSGDKVRGRLTRVTDESLTLLVDKGEASAYPLDKVASIRTTAMSTSTRIVIAAGVVGGILLGLSAYAYLAGD